MGEHKRRRRRHRDWRALVSRVGWGAGVGAVMAVACLGSGLLFALILRLTGTSITFPPNLAGLSALYIGGFIAAGAVVGLFWRWRRDVIGRFLLGILGAAILLAFLTRMESGPIDTWGRDEGVLLLIMAVALGIPAGWQFGKRW